MKKILAFIVCIVLVCAMPLAVFAEETTDDVVDTTPVVEETIPETTVPDVVPTEPTLEEEAQGYADIIAAWFEENSGALGIVFTIIGYGIVLFKKVKTMTASVTTMNNNAVSISENGSKIATDALAIMSGYTDKLTELLAKIEKSEDDKQKLEEALIESHTLLKSARLANKSIADEVAKLITLAGLPNSVKSELYEQHLENVRAIAEAENPEVKEDDREEA